MPEKKRFLFFIVHPSKYHVFRNTINSLKDAGHQVDLLITSKDVLQDLVEREGWHYTNIFPEGRKSNRLPSTVNLVVNAIRTLFRLYRYVKGTRYDLFVTDDLLVFLSGPMKVPSIAFTDDDLSVTKKFSVVLSRATHILSPAITDLERYSHKKIGFDGYKELAYLHPNHFVPDPSIVEQFNPEGHPYYVLRLVSLQAYHDVGMKGLSNNQVSRLIALLETKGRAFISAERELPEQFEKYRLKTDPRDIAHILYHAELFIGDSQTMTSEASVMGTPALRCNDFAGRISVMDEKEDKYQLSYNYLPRNFEDMFARIQSLIADPDLKKKHRERRDRMLQDKIDLSGFMTWLFSTYPESVSEYNDNHEIQQRFK